MIKNVLTLSYFLLVLIFGVLVFNPHFFFFNKRQLHDQVDAKKQILFNQLLQRRVETLQSEIKTLRNARNLNASEQWVYAKIVRFDPNGFSHRLWVDLGEKDGIQKNAAVCIGHQAIGVIDKVGDRCSRVRLISDPLLNISMESGSVEHRQILIHELTNVIEQLGASVVPIETMMDTTTQVKGYTQGLHDPYSKKNPLIKGHFPLFMHHNYEQYVGHTFVTNGFDGVFPPGLIIGIATQIEPTPTHGLEARIMPTISFDSISHVFIQSSQ